MSPRFLAPVCALVLCGSAATLAADDLRPIGDVTAVTRLDNGVNLGCADGSSLRLTVLAPDLIRVRTLFAGQPAAPDHSWAIARPDWPTPVWQLAEAPDALTLSTAELKMVVHRAPLRIEFLDAVVSGIEHVDVIGGVDGDLRRAFELAVAFPRPPENGEQNPLGGENLDAVVSGIGDVNPAVGAHRGRFRIFQLSRVRTAVSER